MSEETEIQNIFLPISRKRCPVSQEAEPNPLSPGVHGLMNLNKILSQLYDTENHKQLEPA